MRADLPVVLGWYAEDVTRILETEVKEVEASIRESFQTQRILSWSQTARMLAFECQAG